MTTVTWSDASDVANSWTLQFGYVHVLYMVDDYVIGYESSGPWTDASDVSTTWTAA